MRFDTPVYFQRITAGEYDKNTGVTDTGNSTLSLLYGEIREGSLIARIQRPYNEPFDRIRIGKKVYRCDLCRRKKVFIVSEVP